MTQPALGLLSSAIVMAIALGFVSLFDFGYACRMGCLRHARPHSDAGRCCSAVGCQPGIREWLAAGPRASFSCS